MLARRRVAVFLGVAFGLSWLTALVIYLTDGLDSGSMVLPGAPRSIVLVAGPYMFAPVVANVVTRVVMGEGLNRTLLRPHVRTHGGRASWRGWLRSRPERLGLVNDVDWLYPVGSSTTSPSARTVGSRSTPST